MNEVRIQEICSYLPHRYPFLLVDRVIDIQEKKLQAIKNVTINEPFFNGHFPQKPVMPGVLILEALAQASGILVLRTMPAKTRVNFWFYLARIDNARFKRVVEPGDQLLLEVELVKMKKDFYKFKCKASTDNQVVCTAEIINARGSVK